QRASLNEPAGFCVQRRFVFELVPRQELQEEVMCRSDFCREEAGTLDFAALAKFWSSERGRLLRAQPHNLIHRELPFTARFSPADLAELSPTIPAKLPPEEFVVVQGVADLAVILPSEIWLLDFKTDHFAAAELDAKRAEHGPQLRLYAAALSRIYGRPVTRRWLHFLALNRTCDV
ncbi:MAG TPA: PD-(D/E)XK nuclease family protein, partial [Verrucomicrobiae bacterium]